MPSGVHLFDFTSIIVVGEVTRSTRWRYGAPQQTSAGVMFFQPPCRGGCAQIPLSSPEYHPNPFLVLEEIIRQCVTIGRLFALLKVFMLIIIWCCCENIEVPFTSIADL